MAGLEDIDAFDSDVSALERTVADATLVTQAFDMQLRATAASMEDATKYMGKLQTGFSGGLRKAFDGLIFDGLKLSDALGAVAKSMIDTAYNAAITPVMNHVGGLLAQGVTGMVTGLIPQANGAPFSQGRIMPFAKGGVVSGATTFPMRGGTGLMGEAGPEAIMPLARGPDGALGVRGGGGGNVSITMNISTPDVQGFQRSQGQIATQMARAISRSQRNR